jgi:hypothetical protein
MISMKSRFRKLTIEEVHRLDVRALSKRHHLKSGSILLIMADNAEQLSIHVEIGAIHIQPMNQRIGLSRTPCNYGGFRLWFVCPGCQHRRTALGLFNNAYLCRVCHSLGYNSQLKGQASRSLRQCRKLRERVGAPDDLIQAIGEKPKGMHWKTFHQIKQLENMYYSMWAQETYILMCQKKNLSIPYALNLPSQSMPSQKAKK